MDYDNDGILDFISGSYDPGDLYLFRGEGGGKYKAVETILDENKLPLVHHPIQLAAYHKSLEGPNADPNGSINDRVASFGSWPAAVDWDDDGDLDMLIGSFGGRLFRRMNIGTRAEPVYSEETHEVHVGGHALQVYCHTNPVAADWDADGRWDLVVGSGDGSVTWYRNIGEKGRPKFSSAETLVEAKASSKFWMQYVAEDADPQPGVRAQICVTDYDLDGHLDLLLGDYSTVRYLDYLDQTQRDEFDELLQSEDEVRERLYKESDKDAVEELREQMRDISEEKESYLLERDEDAPQNSYVWFFRRKPPTTQAVEGEAGAKVPRSP